MTDAGCTRHHPVVNTFDDVINKHGFFIDKSMFIKDFMEHEGRVVAILRPRRFGKSMNLNMLRHFLSYGASPDDFKRFQIGEETEFIKEHCGKYSTICLSLKDCDGLTWEDMRRSIWVSICNMVQPHLKDIKGHYSALKFEDYSTENPPPIFTHALSGSVSALYDNRKRKVIVLIDEYDSPLNVAFRNGYYAEASKFFSEFFSRSLKDHSALEKACLMGIVELGGAGFLSGLNDFDLSTVYDDLFSSYFGFSEEEIRPYALNDTDTVLNWYNGYTFGQYRLINPWSFTCWLKGKRALRGYWTGSSKVESFFTEWADQFSKVLGRAIKLSFNDDSEEELTDVPSSVNYGVVSTSSEMIWYFLLSSGYLTFRAHPENPDIIYAFIPNHEVRKYWQKEMPRILEMNLKEKPGFVNSLIRAMENFELGLLKSLLDEFLLDASCYDLRTENSYHCIIFGTLKLLFRLRENGSTEVTTNKESGKGRYDIAVHFGDLKKVIIFEFKKSRAETNMVDDAKRGLQQIKRNNYAASFPECECYLVAMAFYKKDVSLFETDIVTVPA